MDVTIRDLTPLFYAMIKDYVLALKANTEAAVKGDDTAKFHLGVMYGLGLGVVQDYSAAVNWYRGAAEAGHSRAQANLGFMYGTGRGVPQDFVRAYAWYNLAAAGGEDTARKNRDIVCNLMSAAQLEQAQNMSMELFDQIEKS